MKSLPLVSIVIPIYNVAMYLERCLDSVLSQTYGNLEVILVDDGSTDDSANICEAYAEKDIRIKLIHQENGGPTRARKAGLKLSTGMFVGFVDSDDWIESNMYECLVRPFFEYDVDFVWSGIVVETNDASIMKREITSGLCEHPIENANVWEMIIEDCGYLRGLYCKLFKKELIEAAFQDVPDDCVMGEDYIATASALLQSRKVFFLSNAFYHYDITRPDSLTKCDDINLSFRVAKLYYILHNLLGRYNVYKEVKNSLKNAFVREMLTSLNKWIVGDCIPVYRCACIERLKGKKVVLYGAGKVGRDYYVQICGIPEVHIVGWVDRNPLSLANNIRKVNYVEYIYEVEYDLILISVKDRYLANEIKSDLQVMGVAKEKIIWEPIQKFVPISRGGI